LPGGIRHTGAVIEPTTDPDDVVGSVRDLSDDDLHHLAEVVRQVQIERAIDSGDHDAIIAAGFESGFGRDGLGILPWVEGSVIVCPGGVVSKSKTSHRCRFISVDDVWVWDSGLLLREDKRSSPGTRRASGRSRWCHWSTAPNSTWCPAEPAAVNTRSTTW